MINVLLVGEFSGPTCLDCLVKEAGFARKKSAGFTFAQLSVCCSGELFNCREKSGRVLITNVNILVKNKERSERTIHQSSTTNNGRGYLMYTSCIENRLCTV